MSEFYTLPSSINTPQASIYQKRDEAPTSSRF